MRLSGDIFRRRLSRSAPFGTVGTNGGRLADRGADRHARELPHLGRRPRNDRSPAEPGSTARRASTSASTTGAPSALHTRATVDFPEAMFPVSATLSMQDR